MTKRGDRCLPRPRAFTLVEALVVIAITALLIAIMLPALAAARDSARTVVCMSNQRQLTVAWMSYAHDEHDAPLPYLNTRDNLRTYWWGQEDTDANRTNPSAGFLSPYLSAVNGNHSVFECPAQRDGTYTKQGHTDDAWSSTYGYNAYYLSPATTGYTPIRGFRAVRTSMIHRPADLFVFADTMIFRAGSLHNTGLLDPPALLTSTRGWAPNLSPTTSFRHAGKVVTACADGSATTTPAREDWLVHQPSALGSVGLDNGPHYVPGWDSWKSPVTR